MGKPIDDPKFWADRIASAAKSGRDHHSVYVTRDEHWARINAAHRKILSGELRPGWHVLDAGCGYGRMAELLAPDAYRGVDFSPEFIDEAKRRYPRHDFLVADLKALPFSGGTFDAAFCVSIKQMVRANLGEETWDAMLAELRRVAKKVLILEYEDPEPYEVIEGTCA